MCGKPDHYAWDCTHSKSKNEAVVVQADDNIIAIVSKIMAIKGKVQGWWYDTRTTVHVSCNKTPFKTYSKVNDGHEV